MTACLVGDLRRLSNRMSFLMAATRGETWVRVRWVRVRVRRVRVRK